MKPSLLHDGLHDYDTGKLSRDFDCLGAEQFGTIQLKGPSEFASARLFPYYEHLKSSD